MTIAELITVLNEFPSDWTVEGTNSGSLWVGAPTWDDDKQPVAYVFTDERPPRRMTRSIPTWMGEDHTLYPSVEAWEEWRLEGLPSRED
jgi:hypothetical protein